MPWDTTRYTFSMSQQRTRLVAGCMTGTSLDGLDVAIVKIIGTGLDMRAELLGHHALPLPDDLRATLATLSSGQSSEPITIMRAARALGEFHADGLEQLLLSCTLSLEGEGWGEGEALQRQARNKENNASKLDFVTAHGQTIWHAPRDEQNDSGGGPKSWQLFDPWPIVKRLNVPVCYDLRQADLIAGGEGAPLTPIADWVMYRDHADVVANLGGVLNITKLNIDPSQIEGGDLYPCNLLLDGLCKRYIDKAYDTDGALAERGQVQPALVEVISAAIDEACLGKHSLGREQFSPDWLDRLVESIGDEASPEDVLRTAARLVAVQLGGEFREAGVAQERMVLAGGGANNQTLVTIIEERGYRDVCLSDDLGIPSEAREAMGFAVLGALSQDGVSISLPQVTGATDPGVAGVWAGL
jgi:1,6-anhydro-N-acetylmuramate kinase